MRLKQLGKPIYFTPDTQIFGHSATTLILMAASAIFQAPSICNPLLY